MKTGGKIIPFLWAALAVVAVRIILTAVWYLWPYDVMRINHPIQIITEHPTSGIGDFEYTLDYCKSARYEGKRAVVQHAFVDHVILNTPPTSGPLPSGCHVVTLSIPMPNLQAGEYQLQMVREYQVNPLRKIEVVSVSDKFRIYPRRP